MTEEEIKQPELTEETEVKAETPTKALKAKRSPAKKKVVRTVSQGRAYIQSTYNNTIVTLTDANGNTLAWASAGHCGFKGPKKSTPYAASTIVKAVADKVVYMGLKDLSVFVKGVGQGRDAAVRALNGNGFNILSIKDVTPVPHNGCRLAGRRRI